MGLFFVRWKHYTVINHIEAAILVAAYAVICKKSVIWYKMELSVNNVYLSFKSLWRRTQVFRSPTRNDLMFSNHISKSWKPDLKKWNDRPSVSVLKTCRKSKIRWCSHQGNLWGTFLLQSSLSCKNQWDWIWVSINYHLNIKVQSHIF